MQKSFQTIVLGLVLAVSLSAQVTVGATQAGGGGGGGGAGTSVSATTSISSPLGNALIASTTSDYPVTPGDTLNLAFLQSTQPIAMRLFVEVDGSVNAGIFGRIDARGMTYRDLKAKLEALVDTGYPGSNPSVQLIATGLFTVKVEGEVTDSELKSAWGLSRLSEIVDVSATPYASRRSVLIRNENGSERRFDLFKASRDGDLSNNPYVKPNDTIVLSKAERIVSVSGAVYRPGSYQLLPGEQLRQLIEYYAGGFTGKANLARLTLARDPKPDLALGMITQIDYTKDSDHVLRNFDSIIVPSVTDLLPVVYFEGAIGIPAAAGTEGKPLDAANRIAHVFVPGETLSQALQTLRDGLTSTSDLAKAYLLRNDARIAINLENMLYKSDFSHDIPLEPNDTIIIPFRQYFVTVGGAVRSPGRYPYVPDRSYAYYINLAGGYDPNTSTGNSFSINSVDGQKKNPKDDLEPEDRIYVNDDSFIYNFGKVLAIVGNLATVINVAYTAYSLIPK